MKSRLRKLDEAKMARLEYIASLQVQIPSMKQLAAELGVCQSHVTNLLYHIRLRMVSRETYNDTVRESENRIPTA